MDGLHVYDTLISTHHIRVLTLAPSKDVDAPLQCSLDQEHIDDQDKEYEAISYTWGGQERNQQLRCDGAIIHITPNLASALFCLRYRTRPRRLWADAVCINQGDLDEKARQIPLMARIFRSATQVRVWLGDGEGGESRALDALCSLERVAGPASSSLNHPLAYKSHDPATHQALLDVGKSAKKLLRMPWFGRRWVVQELVLNGNVIFHCGKSRISWQTLHFAFHALPDDMWDDEQLDVQVRRKLGQLRDLWRTWCFANVSPIDCSLYSLMESFHDLECKEHKDRIYAIAGLADDVELELRPSGDGGGVASITPNYQISDEEVFEDLAFKMIRAGKVFKTLARAGASRPGIQSLPSWAPDFRQAGSWPLLAIENEVDFSLVEAREPSDGILPLKIQVYGRKRDTTPTPTPEHVPYDPSRRSDPDVDWSQPLNCLGGLVPDWRPLSVEHVFEPPENWTAQNGLDLKLDIARWLNDRLVPDHVQNGDRGSENMKISDTSLTDPEISRLAGFEMRRVEDMEISRHFHSPPDPKPWPPDLFEYTYHMQWYLIQSQLVTENRVCESSDRLPSLGKWDMRCRFSQYQAPEDQWLPYLAKALSTKTIFIGQRLDFLYHPKRKHSWSRFVGFGPSGLESGDMIFFPSSEIKCAIPVMFLRPAGSECKVIGGGLAWPWPRQAFLFPLLVPRQVEACLV